MMRNLKYFLVFLLSCFCVSTALAASAQHDGQPAQKTAHKTNCHYKKKCMKNKAGKKYCKKVKVCKKVKKT